MNYTDTETEEIFERIYHSTYRDISAYVIYRVKNPEFAKDILQNTYLSFWRQLSRGKRLPENECAPYLKTIARHEAGRLFIREKRLDAMSCPWDDMESELISDSEPETEAIDSHSLSLIYREISGKDITTRKIFLLVYTVGLTLSETAEALKIPLHTVRNRLYRTLSELKEFFGNSEDTQNNHK